MNVKLSKHDCDVAYDTLIMMANSYVPTIVNLKSEGNKKYAEELERAHDELIDVAERIADGACKKKHKSKRK